jgi:hypothetical protein
MRYWRSRSVWFVAAAVGLAACSTQTIQDPDPTSTTTVPATTSTDLASTTVAEIRADFPESGPVEAGTYHIEPSAWSVSGLTLTMPAGWETQYGSAGGIKESGPEEEVGFYFVIVDAIYSDPCIGSAGEAGSDLIEVGPGVDDLVQALLDQPHTVATGPVDTTLGGLPAKRVDLTMADDPETATCNPNLPGNLQIWYSQPVDKYFVLLGDGSASVYILDVDGERQVFLTQVRDATRAEDVAEMQAIIESISFDS